MKPPKRYLGRAVLALALLNPAATGWSEGEISVVTPAAPATPPATVEAAVAAPKELMLNFQNTDLDLVLKFFSDATGQIFLKSDNVRGFITVMSPNRVQLPEALKILQAVLNLKGFTMVS